jgi:hypothetical protein
MAIYVNRIIELFEGARLNCSQLEHLLLGFCILKFKLEHFEEQSWYFRQGRSSNERHMRVLKDSYAHYRERFNAMTVDELIAERTYVNERLAVIREKPMMGLAKGMMIATGKDRLKLLDEWLALKAVVPQLQEADHYAADPGELAELLVIAI